ncbi:MAG: EamA family transporter [Clostridiaceae bacterium]|nr:EamA family transporter [Clostridiaceae bacterium]
MSYSVFFLLLLNVSMLVTGQLFWKSGIQHVGFSLTPEGLFKLFVNPFILSGLVIYVGATLLWFYILSKIPLSTAYPMQSLCYAVTALISFFVFKENIALIKWAGLFLITAGAFLVSRG